MKWIFLNLFILFLPLHAFSQSANAPLNNDYYHLIDRYEILSGHFIPEFQTTSKPYLRKKIGTWVDSLNQSDRIYFNDRDLFNLQYLANDNWEWSESSKNDSKNPILNTFYRKKNDFYHVREDNFDLHVNPVLYLKASEENALQGEASSKRPYLNTRGIEIRGSIDEKVGFYTFLSENQAQFPSYINKRIDSTGVIPHQAYWKDFKQTGVDFFEARGYLSFNATQHVNLQMGYDNHFMGNGYRSMILSDYTSPYLFLKINTNIWKIDYTNIFAELTADAFRTGWGLTGNRRFPKKYMTFHHLGINITDQFNFGLFEAIIFGQDPATSGNNGFEMSYLNPIIFYRAIEQFNGSADNALLGADYKWNIGHSLSLYGQLTLDEFLLDEIMAGEGWWANKYGLQTGLKYINVLGISLLDMQLEYNRVRPYTFSHMDKYGNYTHYKQPLAHPLGANFEEGLAIVRYQPFKKIRLTGKWMKAGYGADETNTNWGSNILKSYNSREQEYGNEIGQGIFTNLNMVQINASYQFKPDLFLELNHTYRHLNSARSVRDEKHHITSLGVRWNISRKGYFF